MAFSEGLINGKGPLDTCKSQPIFYWTAPLTQDDTLYMHYSCRRWNETVLNNNTVLDEQLHIYSNKTLAPIAKRMSEEYHISPPLNSTAFDRTDAWCSLLSPKELLLSRHYWDIIDYHILSYGQPLNTRLGCRYLTQLVNGVDDYLNGNSSVIADLKDAHGRTIYIILTTLIYLTFEQIKEVKYTEYRLIHWSSTLYFEVYTCSDDH
ncbi:699_t:CDS:2, partial [Funneliformis geosporum]